MNKKTILKIVGVSALVAGTVCLVIAGVSQGDITDIVVGVVCLVGLIAAVFGFKGE